MVAELWVNGFVIGGRFSLGFYAARFLSVIVSVIVLFVLLIESTVLYARLSNTIALLRDCGGRSVHAHKPIITLAPA